MRWLDAPGLWRAAAALVFAYPLWIFSRVARGAALENYLRDLNGDDSFYYYVIARNFARGHFSTFDGMNLTNGYHPVWAWLITPTFWFVSTPARSLPVITGVEFALVSTGALCLLLWARQTRTPWLFVVTIPALLLPRLIDGMESATYAAALLVALLFVARLATNPDRSARACAVTLAALPWVRLEGLAFSLAALIAMSVAGLRRQLVARIAIITGSGAAIYFIYNRAAFATWVPVSGSAKVFWSQAWVAAHPSFFERLSLTYAAQDDNRLAVMYFATVACTIAASAFAASYRASPRQKFLDAGMFALASTALGRFLLSAIAVDPAFAHYHWYYVQVYLLAAVVPAYIAARIYFFIPSRFSGAKILLLVSATSALCHLNAFTTVEYQVRRWTNHGKPDWEIASYEGALWMNKHLPPGSVVGSTDAGVLGFFSTGPVVNLDGLVNSRAFLDAQMTGLGKEWVARSPIAYLANAVPASKTDGCEVLAARMRQHGSLEGTCTLMHRGRRFGKRQFYVWQYQRLETPSLTADHRE